MLNQLKEEAIDDLSTIKDIIRWSATKFSESDIYYGHGADNALTEAIHLVLTTISMPIDLPHEYYSAKLTKQERAFIAELVFRRIDERIPTAYLTQRAYFCGLPFYVDERVLIPRSPIGELIEKNFEGIIKKSPERILDLCTGSGCIAIACAYAFELAEVDAVDISFDALAVAEINIDMHNLAHRVIPIQSDLFDSVPPLKYDLIVTNPPYVDAEDMSDLPDEFRVEPELGLIAGNDGLDIVKRILIEAENFLSEDGMLICEVGNSMVHLIEAFPNINFKWLSFENGGAGIFMLSKKDLCEIDW